MEEAPERGSVTTSRAVWIPIAFSLLNAFLSLRKKPEETPLYFGQRRRLHGEMERALTVFQVNFCICHDLCDLGRIPIRSPCLRGFICEMGRKIFKDLSAMRRADTGKELRMGLGGVASLLFHLQGPREERRWGSGVTQR